MRPDPRERVAKGIFRLIGPIVRWALASGLPAGPNVLLTVRGRKTGLPRTIPVAVLDLGDRRFVQASFGETEWVRNLRATPRAIVRTGRQSEAVEVIELDPDSAGQLMFDALASFRQVRPLRIALGPEVRPPAAVFHRFHFRIDTTLEDYVAEARRHPLFELVSRPARAA
jgi:deazaflavin-dependent oxidoreductase (nitroreductase family)